MVNDQLLRILEQEDVDSSDKSNEVSEVSKLLGLLSRVDSLIIFHMAKKGIEAYTLTHHKIGLTRKQYYTRLTQLRKAGLIEKKKNYYFQTTMGSFLEENCVNNVLHTIRNRKKMAMVDVLTKAQKFSEEDLLKMKLTVCGSPN